MVEPSTADREALKRMLQYIKNSPRLVYEFLWQTNQQLRVYSDTDFAGCTSTRRSTSVCCAMVGAHLVKRWSSTQKCITLSSGEAELAGIVKAVSEGLGLRSLSADLGITAELEVHADASAAIGICRRNGIGRVRHLSVGQLCIYIYITS